MPIIYALRRGGYIVAEHSMLALANVYLVPCTADWKSRTAELSGERLLNQHRRMKHPYFSCAGLTYSVWVYMLTEAMVGVVRFHKIHLLSSAMLFNIQLHPLILEIYDPAMALLSLAFLILGKSHIDPMQCLLCCREAIFPLVFLNQLAS